MTYGTTTYIFGQTQLPLKYNNDELKGLIEKFIETAKEFSYSQLCNHILTIAEQENMLDMQPDTSYSQILLTHNDSISITRYLWELIWSKKIMILFKGHQDLNYKIDGTYFIVNK